MALNDFAGKTILINGAGGALGHASAKMLAERGADLVLTDRSQEMLDKVLADCPNAKTVLGDVMKAEDVTRIAAFAEQAFGRPTYGLVCAAGAFGPQRNVLTCSEDEYDFLFDLNVRATWRFCKAVAPQMQRAGAGSIVLFSSTAGFEASRDVSMYSVTKAAIAMLTRNLALNLAPENVRVNCVAPGSIAGPLLNGSIAFAEGAEAQAERLKKIVAAHPMGRVGEPEEVAGAVTYLLSDVASFTTGVSIPIDGGRLV